MPLTVAVIKCVNCKGKHNTSICEKASNILLITNDNHVTYPSVIIDIEGIKCCALIDTGAGASYTSSTLIDRINKKPIRKQYKRIETIMGSSTKSIPVYSVEIRDSDRKFKSQTEINKLEKSVLLELPNPEYQNLQNSYQHLKDIKINDHDKKLELPVHVILGVNDYTRIKTQERPRVGLPGEPIAELTKLGWVILSPGKENASTNILFTKTSLHDYENLCSLDCLGIEEKHEKNNEFIYGEFRKQLGRDSLGNYETNLIWKENHPPLRSNEVNSLGRLHSLTKNLIRSNKLGEYDKIIQEQINEGIIEKVSETKTSEKGKEIYLSHRPVIRESVETT